MSDDGPMLSLVLLLSGVENSAEDALSSLSADYQRGVSAADYEIIVVETASPGSLGAARVHALAGSARHFTLEPTGGSGLIDFACREAKASLLGFVKRPGVVTPRLVEHVLLARKLVDQPLIVVPSYDLVPPSGSIAAAAVPAATPSVLEGPERERDPYELFKAARFSKTNRNGYLCSLDRSELFFCTRSALEELRGRRASVETGDDLYRELAGLPSSRLIVLPGEACFGRRTEADDVSASAVSRNKVDRQPLLFGPLPGQAQQAFRDSIGYAAIHRNLARNAGGTEWPRDPCAPQSVTCSSEADIRIEATSEAPAPLSIVVVVHRIARQAENTLYSLSARHQCNVGESDYEIIVVENHSSEMLGADRALALGANIRYFERDEQGVSPAPAMNFGVSQARGRAVGLMVDGARMATPRLVEHALIALKPYERPLIAVPGYHLGPGVQHVTSLDGYDETAEQRLLASVDWKRSGYRLFEMGSFDDATRNGFLNPMLECTCMICPKACYDEIGGMDERFDLPGGGDVNLDLFDRLVRLPKTRFIVLWGEGTFHQFHGGVSTRGRQEREALLEMFRRQYDALRGQRYATWEREPVLLGTFAGEAHDLLATAVELGGLRYAMVSAAGRAEWPNG